MTVPVLQTSWMCPECCGMMEATGADDDAYFESDYTFTQEVRCVDCGATGCIVAKYRLVDVSLQPYGEREI